MMKEVLLEEVRCFRDVQKIPIRPVTLLVGENSTGKSTVLAMIRAAWSVAHEIRTPDFNEPPFELGAWDTIARFHGGHGKRVPSFALGARFDGLQVGRTQVGPFSVYAHFDEYQGQPDLCSWIVEIGRSSLGLDRKKGQPHALLRVGAGLEIIGPAKGATPVPRSQSLSTALLMARRALSKHWLTRKGSRSPSRVLLALLDEMPTLAAHRPVASAPIRSQPKRTYDALGGRPQPEGGHVPMQLAALAATNPKAFDKLVARLQPYAKEAGLFKSLDVKRLGRKVGDPFQLVIGVGEFPFNLADVGYGVSQILPLLVDALTGRRGRTFLLQQPEVHLHPRAQAALGTFFVREARRRNHCFVVETHSDYIVDRVRLEVSENAGKPEGIRPEDVAILYFERTQSGVKIHTIGIDAAGNLVGAPDGYRAFFLDEERRFLGIR